MFDRVLYIGDTDVEISLKANITLSDIMNMPIVLEDENKCILAEIKDMNPDRVKAKMLGVYWRYIKKT